MFRTEIGGDTDFFEGTDVYFAGAQAVKHDYGVIRDGFFGKEDFAFAQC